jgi:hypothetical protein
MKQGNDAVPVAEMPQGNLPPVEMRWLKQLEGENPQLRKVVADLSLDNEML